MSDRGAPIVTPRAAVPAERRATPVNNHGGTDRGAGQQQDLSDMEIPTFIRRQMD